MLKRYLAQWDVVLLMVNSIIGAGIFGLPNEIFALSGIYSLFAIILCAAIVMVIVLNFAEVGSQFSKTGGPYLYTFEAFGKFPGFIVGWLILISRITAFAALLNIMVDYLSYFHDSFNLPIIKIISMVFITILLLVVNLKGLKNSAKLNNFLTLAKLLPLAIFILIGFLYIDVRQLNFEAPPPNFADFSTTMFILIFAFTGFEAALINTGEMENPKNDIPFALIITLFFVAGFYFMIHVISIGLLPDLAMSKKPLADAAESVLGVYGGLMISFGALISIGGTLNANLLAGSRLPFAFGVEKQFPEIFMRTTKKTLVPYISLILYTVAIVLVSVSGTFIYVLSISVISKIIVFAVISAALLKLRKKSSANNTGFRLHFWKTSSWIAIIVCVFLLFAHKWSDFRDVLIAILVGILIFLAYYTSHSKSKD